MTVQYDIIPKMSTMNHDGPNLTKMNHDGPWWTKSTKMNKVDLDRNSYLSYKTKKKIKVSLLWWHFDLTVAE